jgi:hypothetical protein
MKKLIFGLSLLAFISSCASNKPLNNVPLVWKPTSQEIFALIDLTSLRQSRIAVRPFTDNRQNRSEIGKNIEKTPNKLVTTKDSVGNWCAAQTKALLGKHGLNLSDADPTAVIDGEVIDFHVNEENTYAGSIVVKISVSGPSGHVRWEGMVSGASERFGRSYELDNYYETLSDAYIELVANLLNNKDFVQALKTMPETEAPPQSQMKNSPTATKKRTSRHAR